LTNWKVPLADIDLDEEDIRAVVDVVRSKWLSMGPVTAEFERRFADFIGVKYAFAVVNCTAALHLAHVALGAGTGDTIICPSLTFVATANAIRYTGATPVFADITSTNDLNISPDDIEAKIDDTTKGICVVHYGGYPCDMDRIMSIARRHHLYVVEDVAHAPGAARGVTMPSSASSTRRGVVKKCGSIGDIGCFSFFSNKNMTTGEGGMLTTDSDAIADRINRLRSHGMTSLTWDRERGHSFSYDVTDTGYNYRMDEMHAALGLVQLDKLETNNQRRAEVVNIYREQLAAVAEVATPFHGHEGVSTYHLFPILLQDDHLRLSLMQFMKDRGIQTSIHYPPIHQFSYYRALMPHTQLDRTEHIASRLVTLPLYPMMQRPHIEDVIASIKTWCVTASSRSKTQRGCGQK
jgi:dTDP-4-amino-4,6-dideoxygalactose transaminase